MSGSSIIGIYPLLQNNTSWFVAADFDGENWLKAAQKFFNKAREHNLPAYIERSRSGKGGHVWFFFDQPYPAHKSRKIFLHLIKESGNMDPLDKEDSFDRIFPNQDFLSGKGLGNLIALPLQGNSVRLGNSIFLDPENNFAQFSDQWAFLNTIKRIPAQILDNILEQISDQKSTPDKIISSKIVTLTVGPHIAISKQLMFKQLINFLTENLNFLNSEYLIKRTMGLSTYKIQKYFKAIDKDDNNILIPRGFINRLTEYFNEQNIDFVTKDGLNKLPEVNMGAELPLFDHQKEALNYFSSQDQGILVAPPGSGKTIIGLALIRQKMQPALIITHRKQIYNQWLDRIEDFLKIPKKDIGQYISAKKDTKSPVTVAMIQTLAKAQNLKEISSKFGLVLVDECHHMPARTFRDVLTKFSPKYLYGLTATPTRKNNDEKLIFVYLGDVLSQYLKRDFETLTFTGNLTPRKRKEKEKQINDGHFQILVATGQLIGEGTSLKNIDCLFLVYPFAYEGKLIQYIGRIQHSKANVKVIYDYRDKNIEYLEKLFAKRKKYYNKIA